MKTEVIMQRELFGHTIQQKSKSEFFSVTDLVKAGNKWRMANNIKPFNFNQWIYICMEQFLDIQKNL